MSNLERTTELVWNFCLLTVTLTNGRRRSWFDCWNDESKTFLVHNSVLDKADLVTIDVTFLHSRPWSAITIPVGYSVAICPAMCESQGETQSGEGVSRSPLGLKVWVSFSSTTTYKLSDNVLVSSSIIMPEYLHIEP